MSKRTYVAGHTGMVGSALVRALGNKVVFPEDRFDFRVARETSLAFEVTRPTEAYLAAATVGGIGANRDDPTAFLQDNLQIGVNFFQAAFTYNVRHIVNLGSSCIYPRDAPQPLKEECLLTGPLESTNEAYALAKITTLKLADAYRRQHGLRYFSAMPTNLYGPGDRYDEQRSHVIPAMILKFERAQSHGERIVELWGTGKPLREFLFVDDLAEALVLIMDRYNGDGGGWLNIGSGEEIAIKDLADLIAKKTGFQGTIKWNTEMPDGTPRKFLDSSKIRKLGWKPKTSLENGLEIAVDDFRCKHRHMSLHTQATA